LAARIRALRNGVAGVVSASAEISDLADQLTRLARNISNRDGTSVDFANLLTTLESELQIDGKATTASSARGKHLQPVLGAARPLAEVVEAIKSLDRPVAPATETASAAASKTEKSDEQKPEIDTPRPDEPEAQPPTRDEPEVTKPDVDKPEIEKPQPAKGDVENAAQPEAAKPEAAKPEAAKPEAAKPEAAKPEAAKPEAAKPEAAKPEAAKPEAVQPEAAQPAGPEPTAPIPPADAAKPAALQPGPRKAFGSRPDAPKPLFKAEPAKAQPFKAQPFHAAGLKQPELAKNEPIKAESKAAALKPSPFRTAQPSKPEMFPPQPLKPQGTKPDAQKLAPSAPYLGRATLPGPIPNLRAPLRPSSQLAKSPLSEKADTNSGDTQPQIKNPFEAALLDSTPPGPNTPEANAPEPSTPEPPTPRIAEAKTPEQRGVPAGSNPSARQGETDARRTDPDLHADSPSEAPFVAAVTAPAAAQEIRKLATPLPTPAPVSDLPARRSPIPQNVVRWWRDQPQRRRRLAAGLAVLGVLGTALGIAFTARNEPVESVQSVKTSTPPPAPKPASVVERARAGDAQAIATLEALSPDRRSVEESHALARGRLALRHEEMEKFLNTLRANPSALESKESMAELKAYLENPALSLDVLRAIAELPGSRGADVLYDIWSKRKKADDTAQLAEALLSTENVRSKASPALRIALDAARLKECADVKNWLPVAREYGDRRAVQPLAQLAKRRGCGPGGRKDCFPCLRKDTNLVVAIRAVARRAPPKL
jgi:hypothetical protein